MHISRNFVISRCLRTKLWLRLLYLIGTIVLSFPKKKILDFISNNIRIYFFINTMTSILLLVILYKHYSSSTTFFQYKIGSSFLNNIKKINSLLITKFFTFFLSRNLFLSYTFASHPRSSCLPID